MSKVLDVLKIKRTYCDDCTTGIASFNTFRCKTLELPFRGNQQDISCILPGWYRCKKIVSTNLGECFEITDVFGRTFIRGHSGNFTYQILGCILFGETLVDFDKDGTTDVTNSGKTFGKLMDLLPDEFMLEIK